MKIVRTKKQRGDIRAPTSRKSSIVLSIRETTEWEAGGLGHVALEEVVREAALAEMARTQANSIDVFGSARGRSYVLTAYHLRKD